MKILIAVDGSPCSMRVQEYLASHPALFNAEHDYAVLNVVPDVPPHAAAVVGNAVVTDYYKDEAEKVLSPVLQFLGEQGYRATGSYRHGHTAETIAATAMQGKYDLLIMGSHGHSAFGSLILGSVTTKVLSHCKTPLLIVR